MGNLPIFKVAFRKVAGIPELVHQVKRQEMLKVMGKATEGKIILPRHNNLNKLNTLLERQRAIFRS